jgi:hypothetical protein
MGGWLTITSASRPSKSSLLPAWIVFRGHCFDRETFRIVELLPYAALRTPASERGKSSVRFSRTVSLQAPDRRAGQLRATTSLARLLAKQPKPDQARTMLAEIYNWFTEGFNTPDLKGAKTLLDQLNE